jgi:sortase (surface protein transpeptidase)
MPALGINHSVAAFPCSRSTPPGVGVYRWGCAGTNNVYLLAHAYAAFEPLHDAYVHGRLRKGMKVMYADGSGRVHTYAVTWWRLTTPDKGEFAYAALSHPGMTLQTCVGAHSEYRLIVRLTRVR